MIVRVGVKKEQAQKNWHLVFDDEPSWVNAYFEEVFAEKRVAGVWQGENLISMAHFPTLHMRMRGKFHQVSCVAGVATLPAARGKGAASLAIAQALHACRKGGKSMAFLSPQIQGFYELFGFAPALYIKKADLTCQKSKQDTAFNPITEDQYSAMLRSYDLLMQPYEGVITRSLLRLQKLVKMTYSETGGLMLCATKSGRVVGWWIGKIQKGIAKTEEVMVAQEGLWQDLIHSLARLGAKSVDLYCPIKQAWPFQGVPILRCMARTLDVQKMLTGLHCDGQKEALLRVQDGLFVENSGLWLLRGNHMGLQVEKVQDEGQSAALATPGALAAWVLGNPKALTGQRDEVEKLSQILSAKTSLWWETYG